MEAPNLVFVVDLERGKPFYKRLDFFLETNESQVIHSDLLAFKGIIEIQNEED